LVTEISRRTLGGSISSYAVLGAEGHSNAAKKRGKKASHGRKEIRDQRGVGALGRYPFLTWMNRYLENSGLGEETLKERERRLRRIHRDLESLKTNGIINTTHPEHMTEKEVGAFVNLIKKRGVKKKNFSHEFGALNTLLKYAGNFSGDVYRARNPNQFRNISRSARLPPLTHDEQRRILEGAGRINDDDWLMMEGYAMVILSIASGARHKEVKTGLIQDLHLDKDIEYYHIAHPKGEDTYGEERDPPLRLECVPFLRRYFAKRLSVQAVKPKNNYLFPALRDSGDGKLSTNSITEMVRRVGQDAGVIGLDLHKCRRTFGQFLLDEGASVETVSVLYGHLETSTTERSYCRKKQDMAVQAARNIWADGVQSQTPPPSAGAEKPRIEIQKWDPGYA
jgi:integrase